MRENIISVCVTKHSDNIVLWVTHYYDRDLVGNRYQEKLFLLVAIVIIGR